MCKVLNFLIKKPDGKNCCFEIHYFSQSDFPINLFMLMSVLFRANEMFLKQTQF